MSNRKFSGLRSLPAVVWLASLTICTGCHLKVNPFTDELQGAPMATTPSADAVRAAQGDVRSMQRPFAQTLLRAKDGTVTHGPLFFEDAFEEREDTDSGFAWTGADYLGWIGGGGRFLTNIVFSPISAVVTPPWRVMASDGHPECRGLGSELHDASSQAASGTRATLADGATDQPESLTHRSSHVSRQRRAAPDRSNGAPG